MDEFESTDSNRTSVPLVQLQKLRLPKPLPLEHGGSLPDVELAYETFGKLNPDKSNAILVCHAISGDSHIARHSPGDQAGWWEELVGPGKHIDTDRYFVICSNIVGGCRGTTGPASVNPATAKRYGQSFPTVTVGDMVDAQKQLIDHLGIEQLRAVMGGSLGGHQTMTWGVRYPDRLRTAIVVGSSPRLTAQALAFEVVGRNAIQTDPAFNGGNYYEQDAKPDTGLAIARMLGHITYLSSDAMAKKFDVNRHEPRELDTAFEKRFSVGSYLAYQGDRFTQRFDANSYCTISMALSLVDFGATHEARLETFKPSTCDWLFVSFSSDWLFPPAQSRELVSALTSLGRKVSYCEIPTPAGHDGFLLPQEISSYGPLIAAKLGDPHPTSITPQRLDAAILDMIEEGASVLDLGCGDGHLLAALRARGHEKLCGVDVDTTRLIATAQHGIDVIDADLNLGLPDFEDKQFDVVVISSTLQLVPNVRTLLDAALRVGKQVIVAFPNFAYEPMRKMFFKHGLSPRSPGDYDHAWYETPNKRFPTLHDMKALCDDLELTLVDERYQTRGKSLSEAQLEDPNLHAQTAVLRLKR